MNLNNVTYKDSLNGFLTNNNINKLTHFEKDYCDLPISEIEILTSLKQLHNAKTPGTDCLPPDFYKLFWLDIKALLIHSIVYAIATGELSIEQKRGIITLLPKKDKSRHFLKDWTPIYLLNTDFKILAKLIANAYAYVH